MQQEAILKLRDLHDDKDRKKAMQTASAIDGIDYISVNMEEGMLTVTGDFDPIQLLDKFKKLFSMKIVRICPKDEKKENNQGKNSRGGGKDQKGGGGGGTSGDQIAILKLDLHSEKEKQKAMKTVSGISGVFSIRVTMKDGTVTVKGDFDPIHLVEKKNNLFSMKIHSINHAKDEKNTGGTTSITHSHYPLYPYHTYLPTYYQ